jgi:hypothetical protein
MFWLILIGVAAWALAGSDAAPSSAPPLLSDETCSHVTTGDAEAALRLATKFATRWPAPATTRAELEARLLAFLRHALPECAGAVPQTLDGQPWGELLDARWAAFTGALEGATLEGEGIFGPVARGTQWVIAEVPEGIVEPTPDPGPGPIWTPPGKAPTPGEAPDAGTWTPVDQGDD